MTTSEPAATAVATRVVARLTPCSRDDRAAMLSGVPDRTIHAGHMARTPALHEVEVGGQAPRAGASGSLRVAVWNVERLHYPVDIGATLRAIAPDLCLLSEVDKGMARTGNSHPVAEIVATLGHSYAYAVEFIELGLGAGAELERVSADSNDEGFHGNAVTSGITLEAPFVARFDPGGAWYDHNEWQPRVGGRMAIGGRIRLDGRAVTVVSVHLESHSTPEIRAAQMRRLIDMVAAYDADAPILIAGDVNTAVLPRAEIHADRAGWFARTQAEPDLILHPERSEPMFAVLAERGFAWETANVMGASTVRPDPADPLRPTSKIDWIFTRGLRASAPAIIPALRADGGISSDHDCLAVTIALA